MSLENPDDREQVRVLPLWPTLRTACQFPWQHRRQVGRLLVIPVLLSTLILALGTYWIENIDTSFSGTVLGFAFYQLDLLVFTFFAVSYHRLILKGEHSISRFGMPGWTMRETRFLFWIFAIYLITTLLLTLVGAALGILTMSIGGMTGDVMAVMEHPAYPFVVASVVALPWAYYIGRMSLVLPAVAVDLRPTFNSAMSLSEGNEWRVALLVGGAPIVFWCLLILMSWMTGELSGINGEEASTTIDSSSIVKGGLDEFLYYAWLTIEVAILSFTYRFLSQNVESTPSPQELA